MQYIAAGHGIAKNRRKNIRNFCIIAHIDHGKKYPGEPFTGFYILFPTATYEHRCWMTDLEREGIAIKSHAIQMDYTAKNGKKNISLT